MITIQTATVDEDPECGAVRIYENLPNGYADFRVTRFYGMNEAVLKTDRFYNGGYVLSAFRMEGKEKKSISINIEFSDLDKIIHDLTAMVKSRKSPRSNVVKKWDDTT